MGKKLNQSTARRITGAAPEQPTLAAVLRDRLPGRSWSAVRRLCESGKVRVAGAVVHDASARIDADADVAIDMAAPRPRATVDGFRVVHEDPHLVVFEKPAGISSVPFDRKETGTAMDLIRDYWRQGNRKATATPLYIVHRLDKQTSGLMCFAKSRPGEAGLHRVFQHHLATRTYLALAHGDVSPGRIESRLIPDRGDGLRGSTRRGDEGQHAVTHVEIVERHADATLCRVRLETGRTHQIRIHLAERGHPVVGDDVYTRDRWRAGDHVIEAPRLMLHAATLGFDHPLTAERLVFEAALPPEFTRFLDQIGPTA